jgi:hypothetical protein
VRVEWSGFDSGALPLGASQAVIPVAPACCEAALGCAYLVGLGAIDSSLTLASAQNAKFRDKAGSSTTTRTTRTTRPDDDAPNKHPCAVAPNQHPA